MKNIAVYAEFVTAPYRDQIDQAAEKWGYSVSYFDTRDSLMEEIDKFEILFGYIPPEVLRSAKSLRWVFRLRRGGPLHGPGALAQSGLPADQFIRGLWAYDF